MPWQPTVFIVLVVVRLGHRLLLVHERKHGQLWYLPAGRVEAGETLVAAARRETLEEAGIDICVDGILRIEHTPTAEYTRVRVLFIAHPQDDRPPKGRPDEHTLGASWVSEEELADSDRFPLRGHEVEEIAAYVRSGPPVYPLSLLALEGAPYGP